jgi:hypothetical protein
MIQPVYNLCGSIPVGSTVRVQRRGMDWCCDSKGNTYVYDAPSDEFVSEITIQLDASDSIYTGTNKDKEVRRCDTARNYSWRLPRRWRITLTRSASGS